MEDSSDMKSARAVKMALLREERSREKGNDVHKNGAPGYLNKAEEKQLVKWLEGLLAAGIYPTIAKIREKV